MFLTNLKTSLRNVSIHWQNNNITFKQRQIITACLFECPNGQTATVRSTGTTEKANEGKRESFIRLRGYEGIIVSERLILN